MTDNRGQFADAPCRPLCHLLSPPKWLNDPNGTIFQGAGTWERSDGSDA